MKFDSSLDHYENIRRMREHELENISPRITWADLQPDEVEALYRLNATLLVIEKRYAAEAAQLNPILDARTTHVEGTGQGRFHQVRIANGDVGLSDYELELEIEFYLKVTDPEWDEQDENTLWFCGVPLSKHSRFKNLEPDDFGFGCFHVDHSDPSSGAPFPQCWLFHQLTAYTARTPAYRFPLVRSGDYRTTLGADTIFLLTVIIWPSQVANVHRHQPNKHSARVVRTKLAKYNKR